jgi:tetratricopeptide (TPR) repeat protein
MMLCMAENSTGTITLPALPDALKNAPDVDLLREGFVAVRHALFDQAAACFRAVYERDPSNYYALIELAKAYYQMVELEQANELLQQVVSKSAKNADLLIRAGDAYEGARQDQQAEECFLKAQRAAPLDPGVWARLVWFYEMKGMLPKAKAALARAKEKNVGGPLLSMARAMIARRNSDDASAIAPLQTAIAKLPPQDYRAIRGRYVLAQAMAQSGQEKESIVELERAKSLQDQQPEAVAYRELGAQIVERISAMRTEMLSADLQTWRNEVRTPLPQPLAFLIGYPRSGTTLIEQVIESHPSVHSMEETDVFERTIRVVCPEWLAKDSWKAIVDAQPETIARARQVYFDLMQRLGAPADSGVLLVDKNPALIIRIYWLSRIFPDAKLLFMVRDPRDICISAFQQNLSMSAFNVNWLRWDDTVKHCATVLDNWIQLRKRLPNPVLEIRYEDLIADLPTTGRKVMDFLELDWQAKQEDFVSHARSKTVYSPSAYQVREGLSQKARGKWRRFGRDYSAGGEVLSAVLAQYNYDAE